MIRDAVLREIVGADFFAAIAGADLLLALRGVFRVFLRNFSLQQTSAEHRHGLQSVLLLRTLIGIANHEPAWLVKNLYRGIGGIHTLAAFSGGAAGNDFYILRLDFNIHLLRLRQ